MRTRILEGDELSNLAGVVGGPFYGRFDVIASLGNSQVVVLESDDGSTILAYWPIWVAVHLEPLWLDESVRKNPAAGKQLVEAMRQQLQANRITTAFAIIGFDDVMTHVPLAARLGFKRMAGDLFFVALEDAHDGSSSSTGDQSRGAVLHEPGREQAHQHGTKRRDDGPPDFGE